MLYINGRIAMYYERIYIKQFGGTVVAMIKQVNSSRRDYSLDFFRGLSVLNIIMIHTAFHSGEMYVPNFFSQITLLFDVPLFFFYAGWSSFYSNSVGKLVKNLIKMLIEWIIFISMIDVIQFLISGERIPINIYVQQLYFNGVGVEHLFPSISWSTWYMPAYVIVSLIGTGLIILCKNNKRVISVILVLSVISMLYISQDAINLRVLDMSSYTICYLFFYFLGYLTVEKRRVTLIRTIINMIGIIVVWLILSRCYNMSFWNLQSAKFPPHLIYMVASLLSIVIVIFLRDKSRFNGLLGKGLQYIGSHALYFYFAQGVGASFLFYIVQVISFDNWIIKFVVAYFINAIITIVLGVALSNMYKITNKIFDKIYNKILKYLY